MLINGANFISGQAGAGFHFDGVDDYVAVADGPVWDFGTSDFTIEFWVKLAVLRDTMFLHQESAGGAGGFEFYHRTPGGLVFGLNSTDAADSGTWTPQTNLWYHLAVARSNNFFRIYVNGQLIPASGHARTNAVSNSTGMVRLGSYAAGGYQMAGVLDEVSVYHRALSGAELQSIYAAGEGGKCPPAPLLTGVLGGGSVTRLPEKALYNYGESVMLIATNRPYYQFLQWSDGNANATRIVVAGVVNNLVAIFTNTVPLEELPFRVWDRSYGGSGFDQIRSMEPLSDGGYFVAGDSDSPVGGNKTAPNRGGSDFWLVRIDADGQLIWDRSYGASGPDITPIITSSATNQWRLSGFSSSAPDGMGKTSLAYGDYAVWNVDIDGDGTRIGEASFGGSDRDFAHFVPLAQGGGFIVGHSWSPPSGTKTSTNYGTVDLWLARVAADGNIVWDVSFGGAGEDILGGWALLPDGGVLLAAQSQSEISGNKTSPRQGSRDAWLVRVGPNGEKLWERSYGGIDDDWIFDVQPMPNGDFVVVGQTYSGISGNKTSPPLGVPDVWVLRIDADGNKVSDLTFGGSDYDYASTATVTADGGLLISAASDSPVSGNKTRPAIGGLDVWLLRLDPYCNKLWEEVLGGTDDEYSGTSKVLADGFITGHVSYSGPSGNKSSPLYGDADYWVLRFLTREAPAGMPVILADGQYHPSGAYSSSAAVEVQIQSSFTNATILFSTNGEPPMTGEFYTGPFLVATSAVIRAVAYNSDFTEAFETDFLHLTVREPPEITEQPQNQEAPVGGDVMFSVTATGTEPLDYQWFFNGAEISNATGPTLFRPTVQPGDAGDYSVKVSNLFGSATSAVASLTVEFPPSLSGQPVNTNVAPGTTVTFCVMASGSPPLFYQWRKNGVNIPGATQSCLTIQNAQVPDGGLYDVIVANAAGAVTSDGARLTVNVPRRPPGNDFEDRVGLSNAVGSVSGTNFFATGQTGEPQHAGKPGGSSIWYKWRPAFTGVATFDTRGSSFDTLLAIYRGDGFGTFVNVASDEDGGGFGTSALRYNAETNFEYAIVIDGFAGAQGDFVLSWRLDPAPRLPEITLQPKSQTVAKNSHVEFLVAADGDNLAYQWYFLGTALSRETNSLLIVTNVQMANVGTYVVRVSNAAGTVDSQSAFLEIGPSPEAASEDKFEDLFREQGGPAPFAAQGLARAAAAGGGGSGFLPVSMGTIDSQVLNNTGSGTQQGEAPPCGTIGGSSKWFGLRPTADGIMQIDTMGSSFDTVIAVYTGTNNIFTLKTIACDNNSASDGVRSLVKFAAKAGTNYAIAVDGVNGAQGAITLNWRLGLAPTFTPPAQTSYTARPGESLTLTAGGTSPTSDLTFQWLLNGLVIGGANSSNLLRQPIETSHAGTYKAVLRNFAGTVTGTVATVTVATPVQMAAAVELSNNVPVLHLTGDPGRGYLIEVSSNLTQWAPLRTNSSTFGPLQFIEPIAPNLPQRFYRVIPWP